MCRPDAVVCRAAHLACWCTCPPSRSAYAGSASFQEFHCRIHEVNSLKTSRREFTAEFTVGFVSLQNHACTEGIDPGEFRGGAICGLLRRPSFGFLLLLEAARPGRSFAPASSCLACGMRLG